MNIFRTQKIDSVLKHVGDEEKNLSTFDLTLMSIGSVIGTGVMVLTGIVAATESGPGVAISFVIGAIAAMIIVMSYAELSSNLPSSGGSYTFTYVTLGEILAYIVGLCIVIGYILSMATVASGWSAYFASVLSEFNIHLPKAITTIPSDGGILDLPSILAVIVILFIISAGTKDSKKFNNAMVLTKIGVIVLFLVVGAFYVDTSNWQPFLPYGVKGVMSGAASVFFAYCGFDATASAAPYVKNPKKALPIGLITSLVVCAAIYVGVSLVLTGLTSYENLNVSDALSYTLNLVGRDKIALIVSLGTVIGILAVLFASNFATSQIFSTMSRDGLLPKIFDKKNKKGVPIVSLWVLGLIGALLAGFCNLGNLANFASMAFLMVYGLVCLSVISFRKKYPDIKREFKTPLVPFLPILGAACCLFLMFNLDKSVWLVFIPIFILIVISYFLYGKNHSNQNNIENNSNEKEDLNK